MTGFKKTTILVFFILVCGAFLYLYQFLGLKYFTDAVTRIDNLPPDQKSSAQAIFLGQNNNKFYPGILAKIDGNGKTVKGIWMWGSYGLRYFKLDNKTIYSNFRICKNELWKQDKMNVSINSNIGMKAWSDLTRQGDFVTANLSTNTVEVVDYDWWVFITLNKQEIARKCTNR